ncbi:MAG: tetratricopeptide repeat protein, partial [Candidatus Parvarchaeota archaeon]
LRWGINEDSMLKVLNVCFDQIDKARPHFIGILGNSYGTVPGKGDIKKLTNVPEDQKERWIRNSYSITHMEMDFGVLSKPDMAEYSYFYFKSEKASKPENAVLEESEKLKKLKDEIRSENSPWHWSRTEFQTPQELGEQVKKDFMDMLDRVYPQIGAPSQLEILRSMHSQYSSFLLRNYVEDRQTVDDILGSLEEGKNVLVTGEVGAGKSSILAFVKKEYEREKPGALVIEHYIGAGGNETSKDIALHVLNEVKERIRESQITLQEEEIGSDENKIYDALSRLISYIPNYRETLVVIDGIDQLSNDRDTTFLSFLPRIKILISCREGTGAMKQIERLNYRKIVLKPLDLPRRKEIIRRVLKEQGKELSEDQIMKISSSPATSNPLYLRTLMDELSKIGELREYGESQSDFMDRKIGEYLKKDSLERLYDLMIETLGATLERYFKDKDALPQFLKLIAVSRSGLSEHEIESISGISPLKFQVIRNYLDYHLAEKNGLVDFLHVSLKDAVLKKYLSSDGSERETRQMISDWFSHQEPDKRQIYELPYQLRVIGDKSALKEYIKNVKVFSLFTEVLDSAEYFEFIAYLRFSFENICKEVVETYQSEIFSLPEDLSVRYIASLAYVCLTNSCLKEAEVLFNKSLEMDKKYFGEEHPNVARDLNNLGTVYDQQVRYDDAVIAFKQALEMDKKYFGEEHPNVARDLNNLGMVYGDQGRYDDALIMHKQVLEIDKKYFGEEHPFVAGDLDNLGTVYEQQGRYDDALIMHKQVLEIDKKYFGEEHPFVAGDLDNLGAVYKDQGRYVDALIAFKQALEIHKKYFGEEHPFVAVDLDNLGAVYKDQGRYDDALIAFKQVLEINKKYFGEEHPFVARDLHSLGTVYEQQGRYDDAVIAFKKALEIYKKYFGEEHPNVARDLNNLGMVYGDQGRYDDALIMLKQALEIDKKYFGEEHPFVARDLHSLGTVYEQQGRYDDAVIAFKQVLEIDKKYFGEEHPFVAGDLDNLGAVYEDQGRYDDAVIAFKKALEIYKKYFGEEHPNVVRDLNNLGTVYEQQGRYDDAVIAFKQVLEIDKKYFGEEHPNVARDLNNLGMVYGDQGRYDDALIAFKKALEIYKKYFGEEHPSVARDLFMLGIIKYIERNCKESISFLEEALKVYSKLSEKTNVFSDKIKETEALIDKARKEICQN